MNNCDDCTRSNESIDVFVGTISLPPALKAMIRNQIKGGKS